MNLRWDSNTGFSETLIWRDASEALVNLTGATAKADVRTGPSDTDTLVLSLTTANNRLVLGGTAGTIAFAVTSADMATVDVGVYWWDLVVTRSGYEPEKIATGTVVVADTVTA